MAEIVFDVIVIGTGPDVENFAGRAVQARQAGQRTRSVEYDLGQISGAQLIADGYRSRAKMIVDEDRCVIARRNARGQAAGELIHAFTIAIVGEVPLERLWHLCGVFPTMSKTWHGSWNRTECKQLSYA